MPSAARADLAVRLEAVDRIVEAHGLLGRRHRGALVNAAVVFLAAATEAFIEELYQEAAYRVFAGMSNREFSALFEQTSRRLHNASVVKIELLYFNLGMRWALRGLSWRGFSNETLRENWDDFFTTRNRVAHGARITVPLAALNRWRNMLERFVPIFEGKVATHIAKITQIPPPW